MQKKIIALAVAGLVSGVAFAQTSVTLSGIVDAGYNFGKDETKFDTGAKNTHKYTNFAGGDSNGASSSRLMINVNEDLGNGLKAGYYQEIGLLHFTGGTNRASVTDGINQSTLGAFNRNRQSFLFLESKQLGKVSIGWTNLINDDNTSNIGSRNHVGNAYNASFLKNPTVSATALPQTSIGQYISVAGTNEGIGAGDISRANAISYYSPVFSGFQVMGQYGYAKSSDESDASTGLATKDTDAGYKVWTLGAKYANGPFNAYAGYQKYSASYDALNATVPTTGTDGDESRREWIVSAGYDFGVAKLTGMYFDRKGTASFDSTVAATAGSADTTAKYRGGDIGVKVPFGKFSAFANYGFAKASYDNDLVGTTGLTAINEAEWKVRTYQLGGQYDLSKRTNVYAVYGNAKADGDSDAGWDAKRSVFAVGMRHSF